MAGPLDGFRVIEFGTWQAIPAASAMLADWGADVIKVEPLRGDPGRSTRYIQNIRVPDHINPNFEAANRNKRSVALDVTRDGAAEVLASLVENVDVFLTNYRPSSLQRAGATYEQLKKVNEKLIYLRLSGFGTAGPARDKPGFDRAAYWARSGLQHRFAAGMPYPPDMSSAMGDITTSLAITSAVSGALLARERTGVGQEIDLSLYGTALWVLHIDLQIKLLLGQEIVSVPRTKMPNPLWNVYLAQDGRWIQVCMQQADLYWSAACQALGLEELEHDPRFSSLDVRKENSEALILMMDRVFVEKTSAEWDEILTRHGLIFQVTQTLSDVVQDPQAWENGYFVKVPHPVVGEFATIASPVQFRATPASVRTCAPQLGQHTEELLLEAGYDWDDMARLRERGIIL